jgi:hypothetical protein
VKIHLSLLPQRGRAQVGGVHPMLAGFVANEVDRQIDATLRTARSDLRSRILGIEARTLLSNENEADREVLDRFMRACATVSFAAARQFGEEHAGVRVVRGALGAVEECGRRGGVLHDNDRLALSAACRHAIAALDQIEDRHLAAGFVDMRDCYAALAAGARAE